MKNKKDEKRVLFVKTFPQILGSLGKYQYPKFPRQQ